MHRRTFLAAGSAALASHVRAAPAPELKLALLGQTLIQHALPPDRWPDRSAIEKLLSPFDAGFTNLETVILGPRAGAPTREPLTVHAAATDVLDTLKTLHISILATSNNHAFDLGTGGVLDTMTALRDARLPFAGTGSNLDEASAPALLATSQGTVALVAFATGKIREGGAATASRPGVNELRRTAEGAVNEDDARRILLAIGAARRSGATVIAYHHNHDWEQNPVDVPAWQRGFAKACADSGASVFVGHGVPMLQAIEVYNGVPLFYGLGNFIFQTAKAVGEYGPESWQGLIANCAFTEGRCSAVLLTPLTLNEIGLNGPEDLESRGAPSPAKEATAAAIFERLTDLSRPLGSRIVYADTKSRAVLQL